MEYDSYVEGESDEDQPPTGVTPTGSSANPRGKLSPSSRRKKQVVGISSRVPVDHLKWLLDLLRSDPFKDVVKDVRYLLINNYNTSEWKKEVQQCTVGILHHTKHHGRVNITDINNAMYEEELSYLHDQHGRERVMVVIDDMDQFDDGEKERILGSQPTIQLKSSDLLLIPETRKEEAAHNNIKQIWDVLGGEPEEPQRLTQSREAKRGQPRPTETTPSSKMSKIQREPDKSQHRNQSKACEKTNTSCSLIPPSPKHIISIFSRCTDSYYQWLMDKLKGQEFCNMVDDVRAVYISNKYSEFSREITECTFAILYHSYRWGRINLTDVKDSLYDKELQDLSQRHGRDNVIVVINDIKTTSSEKKLRILENQPSIRRRARKLFLFEEKNKLPENLEKLREILGETKRTQKHGYNDSARQVKEIKRLEKSRDSLEEAEDGDKVGCERRLTETQDYIESRDEDCAALLQNILTNHGKETSEYIQKRSRVQEQLECLLAQLCHKETMIKTQQQTIQEQSRSLQEKEHTIQEQARSLQEKEHTIEEQARSLQEKEHTIEEQARSLQEKEHTIQEQARSLQEKEHTIQEQARSLQEKEHTIEEQARSLQEKEHTIEEQARSLQEKEHTIQEQARSLQEKENTIQEQARSLQEKEHTIQEETCTIKDKECTIKEQIQSLKEKERIIQEYTKKIKTMENTLQDQEEVTKACICETEIKNSEIVKMTRTLKEKESKIEEMTRTLKGKESKIEEMTRTLKGKESKIEEMTRTLKGKERKGHERSRQSHQMRAWTE
ncbi:putative leucine-rich repeat-containing protein DDB_G0290503 [Pelobates fuscus]|uniref:putative leucine-rich repeat-containing protein DDB_G0290503 n=1 Tax=Pelobates fuscus TaxID=191477 RepID=UPI002FE4CE38